MLDALFFIYCLALVLGACWTFRFSFIAWRWFWEHAGRFVFHLLPGAGFGSMLDVSFFIYCLALVLGAC
jgi:hypothetical protein